MHPPAPPLQEPLKLIPVLVMKFAIDPAPLADQLLNPRLAEPVPANENDVIALVLKLTLADAETR